MAALKSILYATGVTICGFICLILACITLFSSTWGHFEERYRGYMAESGYFGLWNVCRKLNYGREICGGPTRFQISNGVSGTLAAISCICFAIFAMLCIIQMTLIILKDTVGMLYKTCVAMKLALAIVGALLAVSAIILFAIEIDDIDQRFIVTKGISFYLQMILAVLSIILVVLGIFDVTFTLCVSNDPRLTEMTGALATPLKPRARHARDQF